MIRAAIAGARSVHVLGWQAEECESAALERLVRKPCLTTAEAYIRGKSAALDELRKLTRYRTGYPLRTAGLDDEVETPGGEFADAVASNVDIDRWIATLSPRCQVIVRGLLSGKYGTEIAKELGISPSAVTLSMQRIPAYRVLRAIA